MNEDTKYEVLNYLERLHRQEMKNEIELYLGKVQKREEEGIIKPNYTNTVKRALNSFLDYLDTGKLPGDTKL